MGLTLDYTRARPVLGVVLAPALERLFAGARDCGAFIEQAGQRQAIHCRAVAEEAVVVATRRGAEAASPLEGVAAQVRRRGGDHLYPVALTFASNPSLFCGGL